MTAAMERGAGGAIEFNGYGQQSKRYGPEGSTTATSGPVSKTGYLNRDRKKKGRQQAIDQMQQLALPGQPAPPAAPGQTDPLGGSVGW